MSKFKTFMFWSLELWALILFSISYLVLRIFYPSCFSFVTLTLNGVKGLWPLFALRFFGRFSPSEWQEGSWTVTFGDAEL